MLRFLITSIILITVLGNSGCGLLESMDRIDQLTARIGGLEADISQMPAGPAREAAAAELISLQAEKQGIQKTLDPWVSYLGIAGSILSLIFGLAIQSKRLGPYVKLARFLVAEIEKGVGSSKEAIQRDAVRVGVETLLHKEVKSQD